MESKEEWNSLVAAHEIPEYKLHVKPEEAAKNTNETRAKTSEVRKCWIRIVAVREHGCICVCKQKKESDKSSLAKIYCTIPV